MEMAKEADGDGEGEREKSNTCQECGATYKKPACLKRHMQSHFLENAFSSCLSLIRCSHGPDLLDVAHTKDLMSILELTVPAGWKVWGHFTGHITFSPLMPIFHDCLFSLKMNQTEAIEEANAKEADKVANQLRSTGISSGGDGAASSSGLVVALQHLSKKKSSVFQAGRLRKRGKKLPWK
ncbi:unnamed protein product [Prunus armeniaca]